MGTYNAYRKKDYQNNGHRVEEEKEKGDESKKTSRGFMDRQKRGRLSFEEDRKTL